jgi:sugar phosphate isomerase/epimerase
VRRNLQTLVPAVKARVAPDRPFGIGLRLSAAAAAALRDEAALAELRRILSDHDLYVFTINGFPYGPFHGVPVKEHVYRPDWQEDERLRYTNLLADLLVGMLPDDPEIEGSISTVPGAFKARATSAAAAAEMTDRLVRHAAHLVALRQRTGRRIALALEPEPCCFIETIGEAIDFFTGHLFAPPAAKRLAALTGLSQAEGADALRSHLGICLDLCHAAVEYEDPAECLSQLDRAGIRIAKVQLSAGLRISDVDAEAAGLLRAFDDKVYLHQVVERRNGTLRRFADLPAALGALAADGAAEEWRVHFHVPIFRADLGRFATTQPFLEAVLARHRAAPVSRHLEVETYSWGVLPESYRGEPVVEAVARELQWVLARLGE